MNYYEKIIQEKRERKNAKSASEWKKILEEKERELEKFQKTSQKTLAKMDKELLKAYDLAEKIDRHKNPAGYGKMLSKAYKLQDELNKKSDEFDKIEKNLIREKNKAEVSWYQAIKSELNKIKNSKEQGYYAKLIAEKRNGSDMREAYFESTDGTFMGWTESEAEEKLKRFPRKHAKLEKYLVPKGERGRYLTDFSEKERV